MRSGALSFLVAASLASSASATLVENYLSKPEVAEVFPSGVLRCVVPAGPGQLT